MNDTSTSISFGVGTGTIRESRIIIISISGAFDMYSKDRAGIELLLSISLVFIV